MISERASYLFGEFVFETGEKILRRNESSQIVQLPPKTCELLAFFVENAGRLVSKEELLEKVWAKTFVEESNLTHHIAVLRKALRESKTGAAQFIETVPRKGYRFVAPVTPKNEFEIVVTERTKTRVTEEEIEAFENPLVGRERETAIVKNLLRRADTRVLTLTGVGGAGKTSLARQVARELSTEFSGGARFVDLSAVGEIALVVPTIARHLEIKSSGAEEDDLIESVGNFLREREILLVLDNFEQVIDAAPEIARFYSGGGKSKIFVTSRARLRLSGEREFRVPPLQLPNEENLPEEIIECAAVRFFVERGREAKQDFELTDENARFVGEICRRLEGLPLAIELAAARLRLLAPAEIQRRLSSQLNFLTGGKRDSPARQQTIRAAIAWSYDLLDAAEKRAFETLAVFAGDFSIEAAETLLDETRKKDAKTATAFDALESLTEQNLIQKIEPDAGGETRFRLLESVREFAAEKLRQSGAENFAKRLHADYFLEFAARSERERRGDNLAGWLPRLRAENDNLRRALAFWLERDAEKVLQMAVALHIFWSVNFQYEEGRRLLAEALEKTDGALPTALRGFACKGAAMLAWKQGDYETARRFYNENLKIGERLRNKLLIAVAENGLGVVSYLRNETAAAKTFFQKALRLSREIGDEILVHSILTGLGEIASVEENYAAARRYNAEVAGFARRRGEYDVLCASLLNMASAAFLEKDFAAAREFYNEAAALAAKPRSDVLLSICLDGFAALAAVADDNPKRAAILSGAAENLRRRIGYELETPDRIFREKYAAQIANVPTASVSDADIDTQRPYTVEEAIQLMFGELTPAESARQSDDRLARLK